MSSLSPKDRVSLCLFTFTDGRRCRTPRTARHPHFCFYHAQKEARAQAAESLAKDLAYFFSGDYLPACDLSTAMARLIPAVIRGDIKPKLARTVAYMFQTQLQTIHLSQDEYINAFETDGWRKAGCRTLGSWFSRVRVLTFSWRSTFYSLKPCLTVSPNFKIPANPFHALHFRVSRSNG